MESSIEDPAPGEVVAEIQPVTFQIVESFRNIHNLLLQKLSEANEYIDLLDFNMP